jgi:hypothetical protein
MVLKALDGLSDADLRRPYRDYQPHDPRAGPLTSDDPVVRYVIGSTENHVEEHLCSIRPLIADVGARRASAFASRSTRVAVT